MLPEGRRHGSSLPLERLCRFDSVTHRAAPRVGRPDGAIESVVQNCVSAWRLSVSAPSFQRTIRV